MLLPELALPLGLGLLLDGVLAGELAGDIGSDIELTEGRGRVEVPELTEDTPFGPGVFSGSRPMDIALASVYVSPGSVVTSKNAQCGTAVPLGME